MHATAVPYHQRLRALFGATESYAFEGYLVYDVLLKTESVHGWVYVCVCMHVHVCVLFTSVYYQLLYTW